MKAIWLLLVAVMVAGVAALLWPDATVQQTSEPPTSTAADAATSNRASPAPVPASKPGASPAAPAREPSPAPPTIAVFQPESLPDGTLRLDGRFIVAGSGSEQDPLVLSWPLLASASEAIDPSKGRTVPPPHIAFLNGQWVQISAFLAPPLWGERTTELLVMKNRWDGCCIGLPPTPFDCIEATLAAPITLGAKHSVSFGTVSGRLVVEPFTAGAFLIGLYRLESAQLEDMKPQ
jgi:hypothetical protein